MSPPLLLDSDRSQRVGWKLVSMLSGAAGTVVARTVIQKVWAVTSRSAQEPPLNPADRRISWPEGLQWALAAGVGASVAHLISQRLAAAGWERATGSAPPGIRT